MAFTIDCTLSNCYQKTVGSEFGDNRKKNHLWMMQKLSWAYFDINAIPYISIL